MNKIELQMEFSIISRPAKFRLKKKDYSSFANNNRSSF